MNILQAISDDQLFRPFLGASLKSWRPWRAALSALYGLPIKSADKALIQTAAALDPSKLPPDGYSQALFLTGRRSGKSRIAAIIAAYEAILAGHEAKLSAGEKGVVPIIAPTKPQGRIVRDYCRAVFNSTPILSGEVARETVEGFELRNGNRIEILAGDWRSIRGYTLIAAIVDEAAFFGLDESSRIKSDSALIQAIAPGLSSVGGRLIAITTPYARKGWCWRQFKRSREQGARQCLVWNTPSRAMNPTLSQKIIDDAYADDPSAARSEYGGEFRDDIETFLTREVVEQYVVKGRQELSPRPKTNYSAFVDMSGGRHDDAALAIAHRDRVVVVDLLHRWKPPFSPDDVIGDCCQVLQKFGLHRVTGDNYAAEFVVASFKKRGVQFRKAEQPKSQLYLELLPQLCSGQVELLDNETLITQLASLERRTRSGGRDVIDHPPGGHDDLANALAGVARIVSISKICVGAL